MDPLLASLGLGITSLGISTPEYLKRTPDPNSVINNADALAEGFDVVNNRQPLPDSGRTPVLHYETPQPGLSGTRQVLFDSNRFASNGIVDGQHRININPNMDRAFLAHELGHVVNQRNPIGRMAGNLRGNRKLSAALALAGVAAPLASSALTPGDDDTTAAIALSTAAALPTLVDEAEASRHALGILKESGLPATRLQRGRLAGGMAGYIAAPLLAGLGGAALGNLLD